MELCFKAPGKTFLLGEYSVLSSGSSLLFCSEPYFEMYLSLDGEGRMDGIHSKSEAGKWVKAHPKDFSNVDVKFVDPHQGSGGWGASSSQFLFVCLWSLMKQGGGNFPSSETLWTFYQKALAGEWKKRGVLSQDFLDDGFKGNGQQVRDKAKGMTSSRRNSRFQKERLFPKGSGADLVAQWQGGFVEFSPSPFLLRKSFWPFKERNFFIVPTGYKVKTHEHLSSLRARGTREFPQKSLVSLNFYVKEGLRALEQNNWMRFVTAIHLFQDSLEKMSLVAEGTSLLLKEIRTWPEVQAVKGCGALGGDTLALFFENSQESVIERRLTTLGLSSFVSSQNVAEGFKAEWRNKQNLGENKVSKGDSRKIFSLVSFLKTEEMYSLLKRERRIEERTETERAAREQ